MGQGIAAQPRGLVAPVFYSVGPFCRRQLDRAHVRDELHGRMLSSCVCACFNRWRRPLMYSLSGSSCCWYISSNARKTSTRCFFSITRSACSNSRRTALYRALVAAGLELISAVFICCWFLVLFIGWLVTELQPRASALLLPRPRASVRSGCAGEHFWRGLIIRGVYVYMAHVKRQI